MEAPPHACLWTILVAARLDVCASGNLNRERFCGSLRFLVALLCRNDGGQASPGMSVAQIPNPQTVIPSEERDLIRFHCY